ncbi:cell division protein FtsL [Fervidibacillus albus]|uniref:Cell division protein FtsL n=1 Tax=Fervidibacillus albus TaxID=2980026 RepID=A0A9E8LW96_9BACI|nr:cell division protein FtsL [Fervidibacillus albus]WAA10627.1 cell division protein FtsL [Fervidibacillus albus]
MSNLARTLQRQERFSPETSSKLRKKKRKITKGEKILYSFLIAIISVICVKMIATQAAIYEVNKEIQLTEAQMDKQEKLLQDLQSQVDELTDYQRLAEEAEKLGLKMDENNIKSVQAQ